ncbi:hypothetical protein AGMMS50230_21630 [Spirochaetia bacterium]|nr:hypothetical protein AGMMS50230_21630 [Spirochaetia bacterium]
MPNVLPKVSIIIPVYNVKQYLRRCLDSIINQTYRNLEIILVDDGSTDGSSIICDDYKKKDIRVIVIHKQNGGLSDARNVGLNIATGYLVGFVDSDDWIEKDMYEVMVDYYLKTQCGIIVCDMFIADDNRYLRYYRYDWKYKDFQVINLPKIMDLMAKDSSIPISHSMCNKLFEKELLHDCVFPVGKLSEDTFVIYECLIKANTICIINAAKYYYYIRNGSTTHNKNNKFAYNYFESGVKRYNDLKDLKTIEENTKLLFLSDTINTGIDLLGSGRIKSDDKKNIKEFIKFHSKINNFLLYRVKIKRILKALLPYGIVKLWQQRRQ